MKKTTALLTITALILAMSACGNQAAAPADTKAAEQTTTAVEQPSETTAEKTEAKEMTAETTTTEATTAKPEQNKSGFKQDATIDETVLIDEDGIKVTAKELTYSKYAASLELTLENNSDKDITLMSGTLGYSCNSVNGVMFSGGYFNSDVKAGKKAKESVSFKYEDLLLYGIDEIAEIELGIYSSLGDFDYTYYPVSQIKTSAADSYAEEHKSDLDEYNKAFRLLKKFNIDLSFHFDAYEGERKNLKSKRDKLQEQLEKMKSDLKPLEDLRYYIGKVIPLDDLPVQTVPVKQSVLESISAAKQEQAEKQAVQTELPSKKKRRNDLE